MTRVGTSFPSHPNEKRVSIVSQKIKTFLWFDNQAEQAAADYVSIFESSQITRVTRFGPEGPGPEGQAITVEFELAGVPFVGLNGGPRFKFTEAISLSVDCESQNEIDRLWNELSAGGAIQQCGWLKDKYGLSWQIVPAQLGQLMNHPTNGSQVMQALLGMTKIDLADLQAAAEGKPHANPKGDA